MIRLLRLFIIMVMLAVLGVAAVNYKYFICGPGGEYCSSSVQAVFMPYMGSSKALAPSSLSSSGGGSRDSRD